MLRKRSEGVISALISPSKPTALHNGKGEANLEPMDEHEKQRFPHTRRRYDRLSALSSTIQWRYAELMVTRHASVVRAILTGGKAKAENEGRGGRLARVCGWRWLGPENNP
jgi:hypothetical protein